MKDIKYSINELAKLAGISTRTLRYYDQIDLLKPSEKSAAGYRYYDENQVDKLQEILFYRELNFKLSEIIKIQSDGHLNRSEILNEQKDLLIEERNKYDQLIQLIDQTINSEEGGTKMTDQQKFEAFKKGAIKENTEKYGSELTEKYSSEEIDESNRKFMNLSEEDYRKMSEVEEEMIKYLIEYDKTKTPELAEQIYLKHQQWLKFTMPNYTPAIYRAIVEMYINDSRFSDYYINKVLKFS
ncbi:MerR family transcriptional regulator [Lactobacillus terrae]|uniref:MerR family transcriptional regulator n=1 Tax=Lactobacillus terrae TaxID=2269374 RepID=UPI000C1B6CF3|nr:MerR family transcriptional regulator [Lactobacillus terrae]